ncbi:MULTISPECIES: DUF4913 domain-containing protein [Streptomyces]|uniref:DUF4913 domain-containing protein n=1 Tax=Streptomyces evansiae TaxID=3075535 RepID=A0ABU2QUP7_9ACTN|nr:MULTISPECIES: DUF4913 domain-containing protein [unclassified Streptomyces]MDT0407767.1 DUF4913 domain-containing protein [Streptomyces sp. DSM 41979]MYQ60912.1 DUF4913 domain-containing protein [Streptomyces sp. SID4926]SCE23856.1 protein of unknown function [Streptomyces sp. DfronAA-171]
MTEENVGPDPIPDEVRLDDDELADVRSALQRKIERASGGTDGAVPALEPLVESEEEGESFFILALGGEEYARELEGLTAWVEYLLLPVYGREISAARPWCPDWREHPEAVARLHGLWLAWQSLTDVEAGLTGPAVWHRDHLDHVMAQLRAADGPFAACTTNAARPAHRLLPSPADLADA